MGQNFDDYPGFQQTTGMPILLQHSVYDTCSVDLIYLFGNMIKGGGTKK